MGVSRKISRVALWSLVLAGSIVAVATGLAWQAPLVVPTSCNPIPPNMKLQGLVLGPQEAKDVLATYGKSSSELRSQMQSGDSIYAFESPTVGGHAVMRGDCYIGQVVSWIR